MKEKSNYRNY